MNWKNINLESSYERSQPILDGYTTEQLLLEVECGVEHITEQAVRSHFESELRKKVLTAREVFESNIGNIVKHAKRERRSA